jgi:poly(3-hydroxybutyrate) depolymerase
MGRYCYKTIHEYYENFTSSSQDILVGKTMRTFYRNKLTAAGDALVLCFPGGSENADDFLNFTDWGDISCTVISLQGQKAANTSSWQNAFPWIYTNFQDDVLFADTVVELFNPQKIFLTGKSDGAGFCILYSQLSKYKHKITAIGVCSGAYFGLDSSTNFGLLSPKNPYPMIPRNILIPSVPIFIIHGTSDKVMPIMGQNYTNPNAIKQLSSTIWSSIDSKVNKNGDSNTYSASIREFVAAIAKQYNKTSPIIIPQSDFTTITYSSFVQFIEINNQNHSWSGHLHSGPGSSSQDNMRVDATYILARFFKLSTDNYTPTVNLIPSGLYAYDGEAIQ